MLYVMQCSFHHKLQGGEEGVAIWVDTIVEVDMAAVLATCTEAVVATGSYRWFL